MNSNFIFKKFLFTIALIVSIKGFAQIEDKLIFSFDQFNQNVYDYSPVLLDTSSKGDVMFGNRNYLGVYGGINTNFLRANVYMKSARNKFHSVGLHAYQSNMGEYIRNNKLLFNYDYRMPFTRKMDLTAGMNIGMSSLILDPANVGGGGKASMLTSTMALGIISSKWMILVSYKDFLDKNFIFKNVQIKNVSSFNLFVHYIQDLSYKTQINYFLLTEMNELHQVNLRGTVLGKINNSFDVGAGYRLDKGLFVIAGLTDLEWQFIKIDLQVSYLAVPRIKVSSIPNQVVELTMKIKY